MSEDQSEPKPAELETKGPEKKSRRWWPIIVLGAAVVAAIVTLVAIRPVWISMQIKRNESAAIGDLRTITGAQTAYNSAHGTYADTFAALTDATHGQPFLEGTWTNPKDGYKFSCQGIDEGVDGSFNCFEATAVPERPGKTGRRSFYTDCSGVIRPVEIDAQGNVVPLPLSWDVPVSGE